MHLTLDLYLCALRDRIPMTTLARLVHTHLLEICPVCAGEWQGGEGGEPVPLPYAEPGPPETAPQVPRAWLVTEEEVERATRRLARRREARRLAREDLNRLLRLPGEAWRDRVAGARTRFRSRAFAERLIDECRARVRDRPREAAALAALVGPALAWTRRHPDLPWGRSLRVRAEAHRANALRVAGDLGAAAAGFRELRDRLAVHPPGDPLVEAELDSLEGSLAIGRRAFADAERLLRRATARYRRVGKPRHEARTVIKLATLTRTLDRLPECLAHLERATALLGPEADPDLLASAVITRINVLCDLDRAAEAAPLLESHRSTFRAWSCGYADVMFRFLRGRIALGLDRPWQAAELFRDTRQDFLDLGRDYDAIINSLYLADALLAAGRTGELRTLATELVPLFRSRGVARETLASLRLLARAATAESVSTRVLHDVRRKVAKADP